MEVKRQQQSIFSTANPHLYVFEDTFLAGLSWPLEPITKLNITNSINVEHNYMQKKIKFFPNAHPFLKSGCSKDATLKANQ